MPADVAIVIPTYMRQERTLRAIRSALRQGGVRADIVVIDDGSPTPFVLPTELADAGVRLLRLPANGGPAVARNAGVAASAAPLIAFLDSDDFFLPDTLARRLTTFEMMTGARPLLLASAVWRWVPGRSVRLYRPVGASSVEIFAGGCWYFPGSTSLFSRSIWELVGPLDAGLRRLEDFEWSLRLGLAGGELRVAPEVAVVIEHSSRAGLARVNSASALLLERYGPGGSHALDGKALARLRAYLALERASSALGEGHFPNLASTLAASFAYRPRLSLHLSNWWASMGGSSDELGKIEDVARSLSH